MEWLWDVGACWGRECICSYYLMFETEMNKVKNFQNSIQTWTSISTMKWNSAPENILRCWVERNWDTSEVDVEAEVELPVIMLEISIKSPSSFKIGNPCPAADTIERRISPILHSEKWVVGVGGDWFWKMNFMKQRKPFNWTISLSVFKDTYHPKNDLVAIKRDSRRKIMPSQPTKK